VFKHLALRIALGVLLSATFISAIKFGASTVSEMNRIRDGNSLAHAQISGSAGTSLSLVTSAMKGMTLISWSAEGYSSSDFDQSISNLAQMKVNWVTFTVFWFMERSDSTEIWPRPDKYTASDSSLVHAIQRAHQLGMKVVLKPMVDVVSGEWRGTIRPANWTLWFGNYTGFTNHFAGLAQTNDVEMLTIGTELRSSQSNETQWRQVIAEARSRFSGNITYAANWDSYGARAIYAQYAIRFWDALDYIGVDAYFPLTNLYSPTVQQLKSAWSQSRLGRNWTRDLYLTSNDWEKKIIFTEIGYYSQDGTNIQPWTGFDPPHQIDLQEQADCYQAALEVFDGKSWFMGWFWWNWEINQTAGGPTDNWYPPQNKPAERVLKYYYGAPPDIAVTDVTCRNALVLRGNIESINVTVQNQGLFAEDFNLTVYANTSIVKTDRVSLQNGSSNVVALAWDTLAFPEGNYSISAYAWPVPFETHTTDNRYLNGWIFILNPADLAVTEITPSKTIVGQGYCVNVSVTVVNQGDYDETSELTVYANNTPLKTQTVSLLGKTARSIIFVWNTTGFNKGDYDISAYVAPVLGETEIDDNLRLFDGAVRIGIPGDINADGKVDLKDVFAVGKAYGSSVGDPRYVSNLDIDNDGKIDLKDYYVTCKNYGKAD